MLEAYGWSDLANRGAGKEGPHSCGPSECVAPDSREALPTDAPFAPTQECGGSLKDALEQEILSRLVTLNHERAAEEKRGLVRWLRPDYQAPVTAALPAEEQDEIELSAGTTAAAKAASLPDKLAWPDGLAAQVAAVQKLVPALGPDPAVNGVGSHRLTSSFGILKMCISGGSP